jgi:hypothetical protein
VTQIAGLSVALDVVCHRPAGAIVASLLNKYGSLSIFGPRLECGSEPQISIPAMFDSQVSVYATLKLEKRHGLPMELYA